MRGSDDVRWPAGVSVLAAVIGAGSFVRAAEMRAFIDFVLEIPRQA
jgi:hypothetical protein